MSGKVYTLLIVGAGLSALGAGLRLYIRFAEPPEPPCQDTITIMVPGETVTCSEKQSIDTKTLDDGTLQIICRCKIKYR